MQRRRVGWIRWGAIALLASSGCATTEATLPEGHLPTSAPSADIVSASYLDIKVDRPLTRPESKGPFSLPESLPGSDAPDIQLPKFAPNTPIAERDQAIREAYPKPDTIKAPDSSFATGQPATLGDLQALARQQSPVLRRAQADVEAAYGAVVQAGLYPNPTVGYQADQWQPNQRGGSAGQQGAFINQTIKWPGKLSLAQKVAGFDFLNAQVGVRRAEVEVTAAVRSAYFGVLIARQSVQTNRALAELADEVYRILLKQVAIGEAAGYEPLQIYAQAAQARLALTQAEANERSAWQQLAAAIGQPNLKPIPLAGRADVIPPRFKPEVLQAALEQHTDLLTARNSIDQAEVDLRQQQLVPYPDLLTNAAVQHDYSSGNNQFNLQLGVTLPVHDRNQGNVRQAAWKVARAREDLEAKRNDLRAKLAEAIGRYEASIAAAKTLQEQVLPNLTRSYRAMVRRYQAEPEKVSQNDLIVAQQNLGQALQQSLSALDSQWKAVVDVLATVQQDELFATGNEPKARPK